MTLAIGDRVYVCVSVNPLHTSWRPYQGRTGTVCRVFPDVEGWVRVALDPTAKDGAARVILAKETAHLLRIPHPYRVGDRVKAVAGAWAPRTGTVHRLGSAVFPERIYVRFDMKPRERRQKVEFVLAAEFVPHDGSEPTYGKQQSMI